MKTVFMYLEVSTNRCNYDATFESVIFLQKIIAEHVH